jgi:hypothetical protein
MSVEEKSNSEDIKQKAGYSQHAGPFYLYFQNVGWTVIKCIES